MSERRVFTTKGTERVVDDALIDKFATGLRGELVRPSDQAYDAARRVWNAMVDKRPALIARCTGTADVIDAVRFARDHDLLVSVRGGGHNYAGKSVCDGGLMIDLSPMKGIHVDPVRKTARAQAGLRLGEFDRETQAFGLATTLGVNTDTGIAGLKLGGGYGWLGGQYGLACDNVMSVDVVTADGRFVTASAGENSDLFWGVRGAGANLGIVGSFEYQLHPVGPVLGGMVVYPISRGKEALRLFDEFSATCPDDVSTVGLLVTAPDGSPAVAIAACYCGVLDQGEKTLRPLRTAVQPMADVIAPQPYVQIQTLFDQAWPPGRRYYNKSSIVRHLNDAAIDTLLAFARAMPTPVSAFALQQLHGQASRVPATETAFPHRYDHFSAYVPSGDGRPSRIRKDHSLGPGVLGGNAAVRGTRGVRHNALEDALDEGQHRVREAYGPNLRPAGRPEEEYTIRPTSSLAIRTSDDAADLKASRRATM